MRKFINKIRDRKLRERCLDKALRATIGGVEDTADVIADAKDYYNWVKDGRTIVPLK